MNHTVEQLAEVVNGTVIGDGTREVRGIATLDAAGPGDIAFVRDAAYRAMAASSAAGAVLVPEDLGIEAVQVVVDDVGGAFARIAQTLHPRPVATTARIHPTAAVDPAAALDDPVEVGPHATIGAGAAIGARSIVHAGAVVGEGVRVGREVILHPRVVLYPGVVLGDRVTIHAGTVVGSDGFGYARQGGSWHRVPQVGGVEIADDVDIGANSAIDCGTMEPTRIGRGTKLDNLIHVGHNCEIGEHNAIAASAALAGSTRLGNDVILAGHVVSAGHLEVAAGTRVGGNSVILRTVDEAGDYMGYPLMRKRQWVRTLHMLEDLIHRRRARVR